MSCSFDNGTLDNNSSVEGEIVFIYYFFLIDTMSGDSIDSEYCQSIILNHPLGK